jgi:hypothetical protein
VDIRWHVFLCIRPLSCDTVPLLYLGQLCQIDGAVELALEQGVEAVLGTQQALLLKSIVHSADIIGKITE